jgi:flagellar basal-body rod protein FlgB
MNLPDMPLLSMLRQRMSWLNERQNVLSQNVANADTPGFTSRDVKPINFDDILQGTGGVTMPTTGGLSATNSRHIAIGSPSAGNGFTSFDSPDIASSPDGNSVSLEEQMIKIADTQAQFQAATNLYAKAMSMMRVAIGRGQG